MTSGQFTSFPLEQIVINRELRQRRELVGITELAESIAGVGLINPILIRRSNNDLIAGERRLEACRLLGWTHVTIQFDDEVDPAQLKLIELEENLKRVDLPWQDQCKAIEDYHNTRKSQNPDWSQDDTATALNKSRPEVTDKLNVAKELAAGNAKILAAPKYTVARGLVKRAEARKDDKALIEFNQSISATPEDKPADTIINADFCEWAKTYSGPKFNFIHCDFPYGIGADTFNQGAASAHGGYDDSEDTYWKLIAALADNSSRLVSEQAHLVFWFSMWYYQETITRLEEAGWNVDPFPLVWHKSDNIGILPDPSRGPRRIYETALIASRGDRKIVRAVSNVFSGPTVRDTHMSEKPEAMLKHFFQMFVDDTTLMLDPTSGSGSSIRAAESMGARYVSGLEINPEFAERANLKLNKARSLRSVK